MKIVFLENRYKTYLYDAVIHNLLSKHEVHWIVQSQAFMPRNGNIHVLSYPKKGDSSLGESPQIDYERILTSDRQRQFFNNSSPYYIYNYAVQIDILLAEIEPDVVFGESTAFHELIMIELCKLRGLIYLNPSTCRYPAGRFSFYQADTLNPFFGSQDKLEYNDALRIIEVIENRSSKPDYMASPVKNRSKSLLDKLKILNSYARGERFNTPSPFKKHQLEKRKKKNIRIWDEMALTALPQNSNRKLLYPLQMQPEANIDVWGRPWRNQVKLIHDLAEVLPSGWELIIKPNPKSKYELSKELLKVCQESPCIIGLKHSVGMKEVFNDFDAVVTVTGTIAMECILSNKPVFPLVQALFNTAPNSIPLTDITLLPQQLQKVEESSFPKASQEQRVAYLNGINKTSYYGIISDPFNDPNCVNEENLNLLTSAFEDILDKVKAVKHVS